MSKSLPTCLLCWIVILLLSGVFSWSYALTPTRRTSSRTQTHTAWLPSFQTAAYTLYRSGSLQLFQQSPSSGSVATKKSTQVAPSKDKDEDPNPSQEVLRPLALLLFTQLILFIGVGAVIPSIPLYGKELGFSNAANGIVISIPAVALLVLAKFSGEWADKARKPAMIGGMAVIAVSDLGTALANGLPMLLLARLGLGAGRSLSEAGEKGLLTDLANQIPSLRGRAVAAQQACVALGIALGAPAGGWVVETYGARAAFLCVTVAALLAMSLYTLLPETVDTLPTQGSKEEDRSSTNVAASEQKSATADWGNLLKDNYWRGLALCQSGASVGFAAKIASVPVLAAATLPGGAAGAGALLSAAGLSGLIGAPLGGILTDRAGAKVAVGVSGILSGVSLVLVPVALNPHLSEWCGDISLSLNNVLLSSNAVAFTAAILAWSIGAAAQGPSLLSLAQTKAPKGGEATALSLPKAFGDGTYIAVPFVLGAVSDHFPNLLGIECAVAGCATLLGVAGLVTLCRDDDYMEDSQ